MNDRVKSVVKRALLFLPGAVAIAFYAQVNPNVVEQAYFAWTWLALYGMAWICFTGSLK